MDTKQLREFGEATVDYIKNFYETIRKRPVYHSVKPKYLQELIPAEVPEKGEPWQEIFKDFDRLIMPGLTQWQSPHFHAFFPSSQSFPAIVSEIFTEGFAQLPVLWHVSPAGSELEVIVMDWLGKLINLPNKFLSSSENGGGGIQKSTSDTILLCLLAAREKKLKSTKCLYPQLTDAEIRGKLVAYTSEDSTSCINKTSVLASVPIRRLSTDEYGSLRGSTLTEAILKDKSQGFIPCCVVATLGTISICAFDNLTEIGPVCNDQEIWLHVDASYAGSAFACPEYHYLMKGIEHADSFNFSPNKSMLINLDSSALWLKDIRQLTEAFRVNRTYFNNQDIAFSPEYRLWQFSTQRKFWALKVWFVLRIYGIEGIQKHIRQHISFAKHFQNLVETDERFEVVSANLGLVCFKIIGEDSLTFNLIEKLQSSKNIFIMEDRNKGKVFVRFIVCSWLSEKQDIDFAWNEIVEQTVQILQMHEKVESKKNTEFDKISQNQEKPHTKK